MTDQTMKRCYKCGHEFPRSPEFFYRNKAKWDGLATECKACSAANGLRWARENPEKHRQSDARFRMSSNGQQKAREKLARWASENPEKVREKAVRWASNNRDKRRANETRRRAQKLESGGTHTADDIQRQHKAQKGKCYYCGVKVGKSYHVDHVVPLSRGGSNGPENIVITCPTCNLAKHDKLPHEWPEGGRLL